jgi:hypothetical protein
MRCLQSFLSSLHKEGRVERKKCLTCDRCSDLPSGLKVQLRSLPDKQWCRLRLGWSKGNATTQLSALRTNEYPDQGQSKKCRLVIRHLTIEDRDMLTTSQGRLYKNRGERNRKAGMVGCQNKTLESRVGEASYVLRQLVIDINMRLF